jgi:hypothetical protein
MQTEPVGTTSTGNHEALDLRALATRLAEDAPYTYTFEDAKRDIKSLIARTEALEGREEVVAQLIKLAISHGVSPAALDRLNDALDELAPVADGAVPNGKPNLVAHWGIDATVCRRREA